MKLTTLSALLLFTWVSLGQAPDCAFNTGNNASVFLMKDAYQSLNPGDVVRVYTEDGCVGTSVLPDDNALAYAVTAWGDDEITPEIDGAVTGKPLTLAIEKRSATTLIDPGGIYADDLAYSPDRLYKVISASFDTTTARLIAELNADVDRIGAELDTAYAIADFLQAHGDSLQTVVDQQHANITDLQYQLSEANARADSLQIVIDNMPDCTQCEQDLTAAQARIADLENDVFQLNAELVAVREKLRLIEYEALSNKGKYKDILDIIYSNP